MNKIMIPIDSAKLRRIALMVDADNELSYVAEIDLMAGNKKVTSMSVSDQTYYETQADITPKAAKLAGKLFDAFEPIIFQAMTGLLIEAGKQTKE